MIDGRFLKVLDGRWIVKVPFKLTIKTTVFKYKKTLKGICLFNCISFCLYTYLAFQERQVEMNLNSTNEHIQPESFKLR